nr:glycosyltransferase [Rhodococcus sp. 06-235-1A]
MWQAERRLMAKEILRTDVDVVHAHWTYEWALTAIELEVDCPVGITIRDAPLTVLRHNFNVYRLMRTALAVRVRISSGKASLFANSPYMASAWSKQMFDRRVPAILPNMSPFVIGNPVVERASHPVVVEVADAGNRKNIKTLLEAFAMVRNVIESVELRLLGPGLEDDSPLASWARDANLDGGVTFLGICNRTDTINELSYAWVHAHAALEESFGNTLVEAMELGTPVLGGQSSGAVPWVLNGGGAGRLTDVASPDSLSADLVDLLSRPDELTRLSRSGTEHVRSAFGPATVAKLHIRAYELMIESHRGVSL